MKKRQKSYNKNSKYNPAHQVRTLDRLTQEIQSHRQLINAISTSHDNHLTHLANFARHDIKNAIQNMDSILSTTPSGGFDANAIHSLGTSLDAIRTTIDNFAKLVPYSTTGTFTLDSLMVAVELLARADMQKDNINIQFDYPRKGTPHIDLPFQAVLQMMNNLVLNSIKSMESVAEKKMFIRAEMHVDHLSMEIKDNGCIIAEENACKIFEYGYSTTGGSGIGLFHAKYLCNEFNGEIKLDLTGDQIYNKAFIINLPLTVQSNGEDRINH